jgi:hypothetical protein
LVTFETISRAASRFETGLAFTTDSFFTAVPFLITLIFNFSVIVNSSLFGFTLLFIPWLCPGAFPDVIIDCKHRAIVETVGFSTFA